LATGLSALFYAVAANSALATTATVGRLFTPVTTCSDTYTYLQTSSGGPSYVIPFNGVITSWSFQAGVTPVSGLKLKVGHAVSGGQFVIDAEAAAGALTANAVNTYQANIPVQAGEVIGIAKSGSGSCGGPILEAGYTITAFTGDVAPSSTPQTPAGTISVALPIQATVVSAPTGQRAAALKKCKRKRTKKARRKCRKNANLLPV